MAEWKALAITPPGKDLFEDVRNVLETLLIYLDVVKAVLETIKAFLVDFGNPIKALIEALIALIKSLIEALKRTGLYAYYDLPNPFKDPSFKRHLGGYQGFNRRFKQSLLDQQDLSRPQPIQGALKGGYILIVADAEGPLKLLALLNILLRFFGQEFLKPQYGPPANVKVVPVGEQGDPILAVTKVFTKQVEALAIEWSLPSTVPPGNDPAFGGLATQISQEFYPPKWFIEKSTVPLTQEISVDQLSDPTAVGFVTNVVPTTAVDPRSNKLIERKIRVHDDYGEPFYKFEFYAIVSPTSNPDMFFAGQLGTFRYIDTAVEPGKTYYYRVRAFSGELSFETNSGSSQGSLVLPPTSLEPDFNQGGQERYVWPSKDNNSPVVMGRPSPILRGQIVKLPADFDVTENIRRIFLAAFALNFHLPLPAPTPVKDANGKPVYGPDGNPLYVAQFTQDGSPIPPLDATAIGRGSISTLAGPVASYQAIPLIGLGNPGAVPVNEATGQKQLMPWQLKLVRFHAARMTVRFAAFFMETGSGVVESFRAFMQGPLPVPGDLTFNTTFAGGIGSATTLEQFLLSLVQVDVQQSTVGSAATAVFETTAFNPGTVEDQTIRQYGSAYSNAIARRNVLAAVNFLLNLAGQGVPPNWTQIALLRDMLPWTGQILYDLLAKIQALLDAFQGLIDEIKAFIDLLIRKIDTLERFIQFLIDILNFIESLSAGFYFLNSGTLGTDVTGWFDVLDTATGTIPASGPGGYTAGLAFAYLAIDVAAFETAFGILF